MKNPTDNLFTWTRLPTAAVIAEMRSLDVLDLIASLQRQEPPPPPTSQAVDWVMSVVPNIDKAGATGKLATIANQSRHEYLKLLHKAAKDKFEEEPASAENEAIYRNLAKRQSRLNLSIKLGLRTEQEIAWVSECRTSAPDGVDHMGEIDFRLYSESYSMQRSLVSELESWTSLLDDIDSGLSALDDNVVRARLNDEISKLFDPSQAYIDRFDVKMGSWDTSVSIVPARALLEKEYAQYVASLESWRDHLDGAGVTDNPAARAAKPPR